MKFHGRIHAPFAFPKKGLSEKLPAKLTHIALKEGQGFNAHPACPRQLLAPLLHSHDGFFWPTCRQLVQDRQDDLLHAEKEMLMTVATTIPAQALAGQLAWHTILAVALFALLALVLSRWFWLFGLRHYTGASA